MPDAITLLRVGVPGQSGANVTAAEKATYVTTSGANVFTAAQEVRVGNTAAVIASSGALTTDRTQVIDTTNKEVEFWNGADLRGFSDAGTTEKFSIDSATGNFQTDGTVTVGGGRVISDTSVWAVVIDGGGVAITTGVKLDLVIPYNCKVTRWDIYADQTGSIVVDIWSDSYANFPPTVADTITTAEKPTLDAAAKNQDTSLNTGAGWTLTQGNTLRFNVDSVATVQRVLMALWVTRL